ncbi:MAG TPA: hypothetical protein VFY97_01175 [Rhodanobacteraceae bacterium]|nr:hypothetical protein [Rhodanobacteraceae bacterium]
MNYARALTERKRALAASRTARDALGASVGEVIGVYQAHPAPTLAGAAGLGFVLAQLRVGSGLIRAGMRIASGPAWGLVRQYLRNVS